MGLEIVFFLGALILLTALIYASLNYHYRDRKTKQAAEDIVRERYHRDEA